MAIYPIAVYQEEQTPGVHNGVVEMDQQNWQVGGEIIDSDTIDAPDLSETDDANLPLHGCTLLDKELNALEELMGDNPELNALEEFMGDKPDDLCGGYA